MRISPDQNYLGMLPRGLFSLWFPLFASLVLGIAVAQAQTPADDVDSDPIRPADTASPRDTLRSFLSDVAVWTEGLRKNQMTAENYRAFRRATETLDFRITPGGNTWSKRFNLVLLMHEVLGRIDLPPDEKIPGEREVVEEGIVQWTIPDTRITIARIEKGQRKGEFLFSGSTVEALDGLYRQVKHLPYKPGVTPGFYEKILQSDRTIAAKEAQIRQRLKPVNTLSPRSALDEFLYSVNRAYALIQETEAALKAKPPTMTRAEAREVEAIAWNLLRQASSAIDLSQTPRALRGDLAIESVLQLKEILDRTYLPPLDSVPNEEMVAEAREQQDSSLFIAGAGGLRWRLPNTEIDIVEISEGPRQGEFLFSARAVERLGENYNRVRDLPYRPERFGGLELAYLSPDLSPGFYEFYISTPGVLVPQAYFQSRLITKLPEGLKTLYAGQTVWQWMALSMAIIGLGLAIYLTFVGIRKVAERQPPPWDRWLLVLVPILAVVLIHLVTKFIAQGVNITGDLLAAVLATGSALVVFFIAWTIIAVSTAVAATIIASPRIEDPSPEASLVRVGAGIAGFLVAAWVVIRGLQDLGADLIPILAGLGVGSLAIALAAQRTLANMLGSLILFINKPVKVGDFCRYGDQIGTVEEIGWISTRIRSLERTIVTVPNAEFSEMQLDNFAVRDERLFKPVLQLRYETTPDQIRYILVQLRKLLIGHPMVSPAPARVRFVGFGAYSKDLEVFAYINCQDHNVFLATQEDLLLRMEEIILTGGSGFAFPSQTAYLARDGGVDNELQSEAEKQIQVLRSRDKLPFPEFEDAERQRLENTLDYPPKGSPGYRPPTNRPKPPPKEELPDEIPEDRDGGQSQ